MADVGNNIGYTWFQRDALIENTQYDSPIIRALNIDPTTPVIKLMDLCIFQCTSTDIANPVNESNNVQYQTSNRIVACYADLIGKSFSFRSTFGLDQTFLFKISFI
jgi:hypothetical protein